MRIFSDVVFTVFITRHATTPFSPVASFTPPARGAHFCHGKTTAKCVFRRPATPKDYFRILPKHRLRPERQRYILLNTRGNSHKVSFWGDFERVESRTNTECGKRRFGKSDRYVSGAKREHVVPRGRRKVAVGGVMLLRRAKPYLVALSKTAAALLTFVGFGSSAKAASSSAPTLGRSVAISRQVQMSAESAFRIVYAAILGSILGLERSNTSRNGGSSTGAGMRTMALVSLGACVFCMCGTHGFAVRCATDAILGSEYASVDASRMASSIATGVGFIGAGVISNIRTPDGTYDKDSVVKGLTTAATIWMSAAIGAAAGAGMYYAACQFVLLCLAILRVGEWADRSKEELGRADKAPKRAKQLSKESAKDASIEGKSLPSPAQPQSSPSLTLTRTIDSIEDRSDLDEAQTLRGRSQQLDIDSVNATKTNNVADGTATEKGSKSVDPLLEKFLQRGGTVSSRGSSSDAYADSFTSTENANGTSTKPSGVYDNQVDS